MDEDGDCIRKVASEEFGVSMGRRSEVKDTWWWNDDVQKAIKEKKDCFRRLYLDRSADNIEKYKMAKKAAKQAVGEARGRAYEDLYQRLGTKEGEGTSIRWLRSGRGRREILAKSNASRTEQANSW